MDQEIKVIPLTLKKPLDPEEAKQTTLGKLINETLQIKKMEIKDKDIFVVTSKLVSLFEERTFKLDSVKPSRKAKILGKIFSTDPRRLQLIMEQGRIKIVSPYKEMLQNPAMTKQLMKYSADFEGLKEHIQTSIDPYLYLIFKYGFIFGDGGIDNSNSPSGYVSVLPRDPCASARKIRDEIKKQTNKDVGVIITDSISPYLGRMGGQDVSIGFAGLDPVVRESGRKDLYGRVCTGGVGLVLEPISAISGLLMGQHAECTPMTLVRGYDYTPEKKEEDKGKSFVLKSADIPLLKPLFSLVLNTLKFHIANFLTFEKWPEDTR